MASLETASVALLATVKVKSEEKKEEAVDRLRRLNEFLRLPRTQCLASATFTSAAKKAPVSMLVGRLEVFPGKSILTAAQESQEYKNYYDSSHGQELFDGEETITLWRPAGGFLKRKNETAAPKAGVLVLAKFICNDNDDAVQNVVKIMGKYCDWVEANEPSVYTYCVMAPQTPTKEVLLFERYKDLSTIKAHGETKEFKSMFKQVSPFIEAKRTELTRWNELDGSFVSSIDLEPKAKL